MAEQIATRPAGFCQMVGVCYRLEEQRRAKRTDTTAVKTSPASAHG